MYRPRTGKQKYCTIDCFYDARRASPRPKVGTIYTTGYKERNIRLILQPNGKHIAEHRLIFEQHYGVKLKPWHRVKHKNDDTLDNRIENLTLTNAYAMEMARQGKSIEKIGKEVCSSGHPKNKWRSTKGGIARERYCPTCDQDRAREIKRLKREATSTPPSE